VQKDVVKGLTLLPLRAG